MIDRLTITLPKELARKVDVHLRPKELCIKDNDYCNHRPIVVAVGKIRNDDGSHALIIEKYNNGTIKICGSLRKFRFGVLSFQDLTLDKFRKVITALAKRLSLSTDDLLKYGRVSRVEIGLSFVTRIDPATIIQRTIKHGRVRHRNDWDNKNETLYCDGSDKKLKIYDKTIELPENIHGIELKNKAVNIVSTLKKHGYSILRIEVEMKKSNSFKKYGIEGVKTLEDLCEVWDKLYVLYATEVEKIRLWHKMDVSEAMTYKEKVIARLVNQYGYKKAVRQYAQRRGRDVGRVGREITDAMIKNPSDDAITNSVLMREVARKLVRISRRKERLDINKLFHRLWKTHKCRMRLI